MREVLKAHPDLHEVPDGVLARLLTRVFFASLETEELEHLPIRVAFVGDRLTEAMPPAGHVSDATGYRWRPLPFQQVLPFDEQHLLKLSRAALAEHLFITVSLRDGDLCIPGLAREGFRLLHDRVVKVVAPSPGRLEIWWGPQRALAYVDGILQAPPDNVLFTAGPVRRALVSFAKEVGVSTGYLSAVAGLVRQFSAHDYGGILVVSKAQDPEVTRASGFAVGEDLPICDLLREVLRVDLEPNQSSVRFMPTYGASSLRVIRNALRSEVDRVIGEIAQLTALDGATILDRSLGLRGFGVILPVDPSVEVLEAADAEATRCSRFELERYGARHRAAASYAQAHPRSVVFVASADGSVACMLRQSEAAPVLLWRFRPSELKLV